MNRKPSDWLKYVKMHVHDGVPMTKLAAKYQFDVAKLKYKVKVYLLHGETPFTDEQEKRIYTREEKLKAIQIVLKGEKSGRQVASDANIVSIVSVLSSNDEQCSFSKNTPTPIALSSLTVLRKSTVFLAKRDIDLTSIISISPALAFFTILL